MNRKCSPRFGTKKRSNTMFLRFCKMTRGSLLFIPLQRLLCLTGFPSCFRNLGVTLCISTLFLLLPFTLRLQFCLSDQRVFVFAVDKMQDFKDNQQEEHNKPSNRKPTAEGRSAFDGVPSRPCSHMHTLLLAWGASLLLVFRLTRWR